MTISKRAALILRGIALSVVLLIASGILIDLFNGLYVLRHSKSVFSALAGLLIIAILYLLGESSSEWIGGKDDLSHPLYKRALRLLALLLFAMLIIATIWLALKLLGVEGV